MAQPVAKSKPQDPNPDTPSASSESELSNSVLDRLRQAEQTLIEQPIHVDMPEAKDIWRDLVEISEKIVSTKQDILSVQSIDPDRLPEAGLQLEEVVSATENATNTIMEQAERILCAEANDLDTYQSMVTDAVTQIFEACSFQDITGQRITKVVDTLNYIEKRVGHINQTIGLAFQQSREEKTEADIRREELLLHGPAREEEKEAEQGNVISQDDIDALFD